MSSPRTTLATLATLATRPHLGDSHNFGRRVTASETRIHKPRTIFWEWLMLSAKSPLRRFFDMAAAKDGLEDRAFGFLPDLDFGDPRARDGGEVQRVVLEPLGELSGEEKSKLARIVGRSLALFSWLGVSDLHWENLVIGAGSGGDVVFAPLDVEMFLAELSMPTETKLIPDADPEVAAICRHACGVRRVLPWLGKPIDPVDLLAMIGAYRQTLAFLDRHSQEIADLLAAEPGLREAPIRVLLRGTGDYVSAGKTRLWPPLLAAEKEQLDRGDIPYFFRLYGRAGIHWFGDAALTELRRLPHEGDVPQLDPMLQVSKGLRSPSRKRLREEGLLTLVGAFDHPSFTGRHELGQYALTFTSKKITLQLPKSDELRSHRKMSEFVGSVYLPCHCGEVRSVFVPPVTKCDAL